jgi:hypothetical protein
MKKFHNNLTSRIIIYLLFIFISNKNGFLFVKEQSSCHINCLLASSGCFLYHKNIIPLYAFCNKKIFWLEFQNTLSNAIITYPWTCIKRLFVVLVENIKSVRFIWQRFKNPIESIFVYFIIGFIHFCVYISSFFKIERIHSREAIRCIQIFAKLNIFESVILNF